MYTSVNVAVNGEVKMGGYRSSEHLIVPIGFEYRPPTRSSPPAPRHILGHRWTL